MTSDSDNPATVMHWLKPDNDGQPEYLCRTEDQTVDVWYQDEWRRQPQSAIGALVEDQAQWRRVVDEGFIAIHKIELNHSSDEEWPPAALT